MSRAKPSVTPAPAAGDPSHVPDQLVIQAFARIDAVALGVALGAAVGMMVAAVTLTLVAKGGGLVGPNLQLLSQYFIGYSVTLPGSLIGLTCGFFAGFILGWAGASLRNLLLDLYLYLVKLGSLHDYIDP